MDFPRREFASSVLPDGETDVCSDGRTVWVNRRGLCLARFCPISYEYAGVTPKDSVDGLSYVADMKYHLHKPFAWVDFLDGVKKRWGIEIGPEHKPLGA